LIGLEKTQACLVDRQVSESPESVELVGTNIEQPSKLDDNKPFSGNIIVEVFQDESQEKEGTNERKRKRSNSPTTIESSEMQVVELIDTEEISDGDISEEMENDTLRGN